jgi:hypothetical protein
LSKPALKALVEVMAYELTVTDSGNMLYSITPPTEPIDHYIKDFVGKNDIGL